MSAHGYMIDAWDFSSGSPKQLHDFGAFAPNCWYHCQRTDDKLPAWLASIGVSHELIQAIMAEDTRPRFQKIGEEGFFMILRGVNLNPGAEPDDMLTHVSQRLLNQKDTAQAISETITSYLDYIWVLREHMQQALSEAMNRNSYWLSMVAGVFLPLGFLTGLFGINIAGMPGTDDPTAFALFCAGLGLLGAIEYLLFRRLKFL